MNGYYNPIVRTFGLVRRVLMEVTGLPRGCFRPDTPLDTVIPPGRGGEVTEGLRREGLEPPWWWVSGYVAIGCVVLIAVAVGLAVAANAGVLVGLLAFGLNLAVVACFAAVPAPRTPVVPSPGWGMTLGELAVSCTRFRDHKASGYRWSRGDIALKVRLIVSEHLGVPLSRVREDSSFVEDFGTD